MTNNPSRFQRWLHGILENQDTEAWAAGLLRALCEVDTAISDDTGKLRRAENRCFEICRGYLESMGDALGRLLPIDGPAMEKDPDYTIPYYARFQKDDPAAVYSGRTNLLVSALPEIPGRRWILNAHVDTVAPFISPSMEENGVMFGRGTADDKGGVVTAMLVWRLLHQAVDQNVLPAVPPLDLLFVIDEEAGGNGTLGALPYLDAPEDSPVIVLEPTNGVPHPANRGAVWFSLELTAHGEAVRRLLPEAACWMIAAMGDAGKNLRRSSRHPLFGEDDVQTCFGVLNEYGDHPSSACPELDIIVAHRPSPGSNEALPVLLSESFSKLLREEHIRHHADAPAAEPMDDSGRWRVRFASQGGHMGSKTRDDDAILKAAATIRRMGATGRIELSLPIRSDTIRVEGGQGFLPDRSLESVKEDIGNAARSGLDEFCACKNISAAGFQYKLTFDKLHNRAYCSRQNTTASLLAEKAEQFTGRPPAPVTGWQASCDARILSRNFDEVVTFGAGRLEHAHQANEHVSLKELAQVAAAIAYSIVATGGEAQ